MEIKRIVTVAAGVLTALLSGCFNPNIEVAVSPELEKHYGLNPSFEVDIATVTEEEANQLKTLGVEIYFSSKTPLRESLKPATLTFSRNLKSSAVLKHGDPCWDEWSKKEAEKLLLTVNLPPGGSDALKAQAQNDRRIFVMEYSKSAIFPQTLHFEVTANGITKLK